MPDDQLAWLKVKQGCRINLGSLVPPGKLPNSMLGLPDVVASPLLGLSNIVADFGEINFFFIQS